jgi:hypothetical protein
MTLRKEEIKSGKVAEEEDLSSERLCSICGCPLYYKDYLTEVRKRRSWEEKKARIYWERSELAVPCCECFSLLDEIKSKTASMREKFLSLDLNRFVFSEPEKARIILENLELFEIITSKEKERIEEKLKLQSHISNRKVFLS